MEIIEIIVIIVSISIVVGVFGNYIYKKIHHISTECDTCRISMKRTLKKIDKELKKEFNK